MQKVLIDSDVILDFFFDRNPFAIHASQILSLCENKKIKGYVTPVMISNIYYLLRKTAKHEKVIEHLKTLLSLLDVAIINKQIILDALHSNFKDFEDAMQNYTAQNDKNIQVIITRNLKDYKNSTLAIMSPENYLKTI